MNTIGKLEQDLLQIFPSADAEEWDRTGLLVGDPTQEITGVAFALDVTKDAINQAAANNCNLLITHHPAFLTAPDNFTPAASPATSSGAYIYHAIKNNVALMCFHTTLDASPAINAPFGKLLSGSFEDVMITLNSDSSKGYGRIYRINETTLNNLALDCGENFGRPARVWGVANAPIRRVAYFTGAASGFEQNALDSNIDCMICGEIKYHNALDAMHAGLNIIELGHDQSELPLVDVLCKQVQNLRAHIDNLLIIHQDKNWFTASPDSAARADITNKQA